jgi:1,4-alpha-glucan branching enzyme
MGARLGVHGGSPGCFFSVWAPNAERVSVIGDHNEWDAEASPLERLPSSGIWCGFSPGVRQGALYKFRIHGPKGYRVDKADPFGLCHEVPPSQASRVWNLDYEWSDSEWMQSRKSKIALDAPVSIYEVHLGSWRKSDSGQWLGYRELAPLLADHANAHGFTHIELLPITEHPFYGSWGYQVTGYFAPTSRYGSPQDLMYFIDYLHQAGLGVILDWVPAHFPTDEHGLGFFDGTHLFEHADERRGFHPDWKTFIYNYGRHEVKSFLESSAVFWLDRYHIDGLRVDGVASMLYLDYSREEGEWVPNEHGGRENLEAVALLREVNEAIYADFPDVHTIAEESTAWPQVSRPTDQGGLGFGMKWDMGWMHDTLKYFERDPIHRRHHHGELVFRADYAFSENYVMPLSHDEVVHGKGSMLGKMPGDPWQKRANLRLLYSYMFASPGKKLLFMGNELAVDGEWNHDAALDWSAQNDEERAGIGRLITALNNLYRDTPALHQLDCESAGFRWIDSHDAERSVLAFSRHGRDDADRAIAVFNLTPTVHKGHRFGVDDATTVWREALNSDSEQFGGSGVENTGELVASNVAAHGRSHSIELTLPPLAALFLVPA